MEIYLSLARKTTALDHAVDYKQNLDEEEERIYLTAINEAVITFLSQHGKTLASF